MCPEILIKGYSQEGTKRAGGVTEMKESTLVIVKSMLRQTSVDLNGASATVFGEQVVLDINSNKGNNNKDVF